MTMEMDTETGSKKVGDCDHESESKSNAAIDLLPPEMLQSVYNRLPFKDLLSCREVNKKWKSVATDPVRKRCGPLAFSRPDIPESQRSRAIQSFCQLIRATDQQGEFPVTEFKLGLNSEFYWIEMDGSTLISQFLESVSPFVKHIIFYFNEKSRQVPNNSLALPQDLTFPNLTKITVQVFEEQNIHCVIFSFIRNIIEKCPNIKEVHPHLYNNGAIRRCIVETGIDQKADLVTSLIITAPKEETDFEYLNKFGFKLEYFSLNLAQHNGNTGVLKEFLKTQSDTLTCLDLNLGNGNGYHQYFMELPCLPHLKDLSVDCCCSYHEVEQQFPTLFYKEKLPALKKLNLREAQFEANYFMANHMAPSESLRELILPEKDIEDAGGVIWQAARLFPNLKKLQVFHESAGHYMRDIYEELPGIEELCITTDGCVNVDSIITGLPERLLRKIELEKELLENRSYPLSKALAMLEQGTTKTLACLENLKILKICRGHHDSVDVVQGEDFTELSGIVLKQMKSLQRIDFGIRKHGPIIGATLKEDLEAHGIKLFYQRPRYIPSRTDFILSLTDDESDDSDSDYPSSGPDDTDYWYSGSD